MKIGISGHQRLSSPGRWAWVRRELTRQVQGLPGSQIGVTSLAAGSDQVFAQVILEQGGVILAVIPFPDYGARFSSAKDRETYTDLLSKAESVEILDAAATDEEGYLRAGRMVVDRSDFLLAVWDGKPARGLGGTADVVSYARQVGRPVVQLDPYSRVVATLS